MLPTPEGAPPPSGEAIKGPGESPERGQCGLTIRADAPRGAEGARNERAT